MLRAAERQKGSQYSHIGAWGVTNIMLNNVFPFSSNISKGIWTMMLLLAQRWCFWHYFFCFCPPCLSCEVWLNFVLWLWAKVPLEENVDTLIWVDFTYFCVLRRRAFTVGRRGAVCRMKDGMLGKKSSFPVSNIGSSYPLERLGYLLYKRLTA